MSDMTSVFKDLIEKQMPKTDFSVLKKRKRHCDVPYRQEYEELHKILCHSIYALKYIQHIIIMGKYACSLSFFQM